MAFPSSSSAAFASFPSASSPPFTFGTASFSSIGKSTTNTKSPTKERSLEDGIEGIVSFPSRGFVSYRIEIVAKDKKLYIWLEDRKTKQQWRTEELAMNEFVTDDVMIPHATFDDYAQCFCNCLTASYTTDSDFTRDLVALANGKPGCELRLTLKIRVFSSTWTPTYSFVLKPVPLEAVDLLAAKVRDQEDQIAELTRQLEVLNEKKTVDPTTKPPVFARATLVSNVGCSKLVWKADNVEVLGKFVFHSSGAIQFTRGGTFAVHVAVQNTNSNNSTTLDLVVNGTIVVSCVDSNANAHQHTTSIYHITISSHGCAGRRDRGHVPWEQPSTRG